jgi:hypothetical protein
LATREEEILEKIISPVTLLTYKQSQIPFVRIPRKSPPPPVVEPTIAQVDNGSEELLLDALIGEVCGDDDAMEQPMNIQEVFASV